MHGAQLMCDECDSVFLSLAIEMDIFPKFELEVDLFDIYNYIQKQIFPMPT